MTIDNQPELSTNGQTVDHPTSKMDLISPSQTMSGSPDLAQPVGSRCNLTLVLQEKMRMELVQRPLPPKPKPNEVQLATHTVGICGSDVKYWTHGKIGNFILTKPMILGHETSAIVIDIGENVKHLKPGDKVACEVGLPCSNCNICRNGKYNLCNQMAFAATPPYDGTLTRYFNHPASFCFKLPETVSLEEGALLEPLAVGVHACQRAPIKLGQAVLVCGAGPVGLICMLSAKAFGASHVIVTDVLEHRLKIARELGASATFLAGRNIDEDVLVNNVRDYLSKEKPDNDGVDVVLECSGAEASIRLALRTACTGGQVVCVGCQPDTVTIPLGSAAMSEIDIKSVFRYRNCYPLALALVESGKIDLKPLVSHRFTLEDSLEAFRLCSQGEGIKIVINCIDNKNDQQQAKINNGKSNNNSAN